MSHAPDSLRMLQRCAPHAHRPGIVLPVVLGVLVLVELLTVTILISTTQEVLVARERAAAIQAQLAARSTAAQRVAAPIAGAQALAPLARLQLLADSLAGVYAELQRLSPGTFALRTSARAGGGAGWTKADLGMLLTGLDPESVLARVPGALNVVTAAQLEGTSIVDASKAGQPPANWLAASCQSWLTSLPDSVAALAHAAGANLLIATDAVLIGAPPIVEQTMSVDTVQTFGGWAYGRVIGLADHRVSGTLELAPTAGGGICQTSAHSNWGAPLEPTHPCSAHFPLLYSTGLIVSAGAGQGTLIVDGDLVMEAGARFYGLVIVMGNLVMRSGAQIEGAVLARSAHLQDAAVRRSNCALTRALLSAPAFNRLLPRRSRVWVPVF